jgi:hypothetical protein
MPRFRAQFDIQADIVLPEGEKPLVLGGRGYEVLLRNGETGEDGHVHLLEAIIVGTSESMDEAISDLQSALADHLDFVTFATQSRFWIKGCRSVIEWDDGLKERRMAHIHYSDPRLPPSRELHPGVADTVNTFLALTLADYLHAALDAYRHGCIATTREDQVGCFFRAIELVAEHRTEKQQVPILCPSCRSALGCNVCGSEAMRTPFAKQAIDVLIQGITGREDDKLSKMLFGFRNGLTHGRRTASIEKQFKCPVQKCVEILASFAWTAISSEIGPQCPNWDTMFFATYGGSVVVPVFQARAIGVMTQTSDGPLPTEAEIPRAKITMMTNFDPPPAAAG